MSVSDERNSCRSCRFKKCLNVGMDPSGSWDKKFRVSLGIFKYNVRIVQEDLKKEGLKQHKKELHGF